MNCLAIGGLRLSTDLSQEEYITMMRKNLAMKCTLSTGLGTLLLGCILAANSPTGQSNTIHDGDESETISSSPGENPQVEGGIDYENAKPMSLPSVPTPPHLEGRPGIPSTGQTQDTPGSSPGGIGSGEQNPKVLVPPKPQSGL